MSTFTVTMSQRPVVMTVMLLVALNLLVLVGAAVAAILLAPDEFDNFFHAFVDVVSFLIIPAFAADVENMALLIIANIVVVVGLVLFTGTIIAIVTTMLREFIFNKGKAKGKLNLNDHVVILRYNVEVPAILIDLMNSCREKTVLILSDKPRAYVLAELSASLANLKVKPKGRLRLLVRQGEPSSLSELEEIALTNASGLLIMNDSVSEGSSDQLCSADYATLKLVLNLASINFKSRIPIGVETSTIGAADIMRRLKNEIDGLHDKDIQFFSHNRKLGQFLAIAVNCPELSGVLTDLLSYKGSTFYPIERMTRETYLMHYGLGLPTIYFDDNMFVLAESKADATKKRSRAYKTDRVLRVSENYKKKQLLKLFIIGENKKQKYMLESLLSDNPGMQVKHYGVGEIERFATDLSREGCSLTTAVIFSDDTVSPEKYDANVFLTLIELSATVGIEARPFTIVAEILEPNNQKSLEKFNVQNIVVSTKLISLFAARLLSDIKAERFYEEIFSYTSDKMNVRVSEASEIFDITEPTAFSSYAEFTHAVFNGNGKKLLPLGIIRDNKNIFFTDQDKPQKFTLKPNDKIIYSKFEISE